MYFKDTVLIIMSECCSMLSIVIYMYKVQNLNYKLLNSKIVDFYDTQMFEILFSP